MAKTYSEKLRDPRWQRKRLEVMQRDDFTCQKCFDDTSTLNVHHRLYWPGREPWDYTDHCLITLCEDCHRQEQEARPEADQFLRATLLDRGYFAEDVSLLASAIFTSGNQNPNYFLDLVYHISTNQEALELVSKHFHDQVKQGLVFTPERTALK